MIVDTGPDWQRIMEDRMVVDARSDQLGMLTETIMVNTTFDQFGTLKKRALVEIMTVEARTMMGGCFGGGQLCQIELILGHMALSTYKYYCNDYI